MSLFDTCIARVLISEGGLVDNPNDPGKLTNFGISQKAYPSLDIKHLTRTDAIAIYRRDYWDKIRGDDLPAAVAFQVLDAAVNHGNAKAILWLQSAAGVTTDGQLGPKSMAAIQAADPMSLVLTFNALRLDFYASLEKFLTFGRGWVRRVADNLGYAIQDAKA